MLFVSVMLLSDWMAWLSCIIFFSLAELFFCRGLLDWDWYWYWAAYSKSCIMVGRVGTF